MSETEALGSSGADGEPSAVQALVNCLAHLDGGEYLEVRARGFPAPALLRVDALRVAVGQAPRPASGPLGGKVDGTGCAALRAPVSVAELKDTFAALAREGRTTPDSVVARAASQAADDVDRAVEVLCGVAGRRARDLELADPGSGVDSGTRVAFRTRCRPGLVPGVAVDMVLGSRGAAGTPRRRAGRSVAGWLVARLRPGRWRRASMSLHRGGDGRS